MIPLALKLRGRTRECNETGLLRFCHGSNRASKAAEYEKKRHAPEDIDLSNSAPTLDQLLIQSYNLYPRMPLCQVNCCNTDPHILGMKGIPNGWLLDVHFRRGILKKLTNKG